MAGLFVWGSGEREHRRLQLLREVGGIAFAHAGCMNSPFAWAARHPFDFEYAAPPLRRPS